MVCPPPHLPCFTPRGYQCWGWYPTPTPKVVPSSKWFYIRCYHRNGCLAGDYVLLTFRGTKWMNHFRLTMATTSSFWSIFPLDIFISFQNWRATYLFFPSFRSTPRPQNNVLTRVCLSALAIVDISERNTNHPKLTSPRSPLCFINFTMAWDSRNHLKRYRSTLLWQCHHCKNEEDEERRGNR